MRLFPQASRQAAMALAFSLLIAGLTLPALADDQVFGPPNMLKTLPTPFSSGPRRIESANDQPVTDPISISGRRTLAGRLRLSDRLVPPRLYLPGRMVLGRSEEFVIKGKAGAWAAIAMADKNSGSKEIGGRKIRLGPDRKLVSLVKIGESGIGQMFIETPVQGDMIGQSLYFEAVVWTKDDFSDMEVAQTVSPEQAEGADNGVLVAAEPEMKKGLKFGAATALPPSQGAPAGSLGSNKP